MFHKFWVGETEEEKAWRRKQEEAAASYIAYQELEKQHDELFRTQVKTVNILFQYCIMFYVVLFRVVKWIVVFTWNSIRKLTYQLRKKE